MAKTFTKFGLKKSLSLADVPNKLEALNNLLRDLNTSKESFTWEDLKLLKNLYLTDVTKQTFITASDATVKLSSADGSFGIYEPLVTLENRFDRAYFTTSEPFFFGGNGLSADYYDNNSIVRESSGNPASNFIGFTPNSIVKSDNFWEQGDFLYSNKIITDFLSLYGAVQWTGYFKPDVNGTFQLRIETGGYLKVEFDDKTQSRDFTFDPATGTFNYNNTNFSANTGGSTGGLITLLDETKLDQSSDLTTAVINGTTDKLGDPRVKFISLGNLTQWEAYKIRITYFIDEASIIPGNNLPKSININVITPYNQTSTELNYKRLYTKDYFNNYDIGDFKNFIDRSILEGGTGIGTKNTIGAVKNTFSNTNVNGNSYASVTNFNPLVSYYKFPKSITEVELAVSGCNVIQNTSNIPIVNSNPNSTENIEIGNYVFGSNIPAGCRVTNIIVNDSIEVSPVPTGNASSTTLTFVDHRGLVAYGTGLVSQDKVTTITNSFKLSDISEDQILLSSGLSSTFNDETTTPTTSNVAITGKVIKSYSGSQILFKDATATTSVGTQKFYVYQTTGLNNDGIKTYCQGTFAKRIRAGNGVNTSSFTYTNTGQTTLTIRLDDVEGLQNGMYAHLFPTLNYSTRGSGTSTELYSQITIVDVNTSTKDVTLTKSGGGSVLLANLTYVPTVITSIVFTAIGDDVNRELCFVPTDTSPPFSASSTGLTTNFNVSLVKKFTSTGGADAGVLNNDGKLIYSALEINHETANVSSNVLTWSNQNLTGFLPIEVPTEVSGKQYYIILGS